MYGVFHHQVLLRFAVATGAIALLFTVLRADPTQSFGFGAALLFWLAHVGSGLACCIAIATLMNRFDVLARVPAPLRLLVAGVSASLVFAPLAVTVEEWLPATQELEDDTGLIATWEAQGGLPGIAAEWVHLAPPFVLTWMLLNWGAFAAAVTREPAAAAADPVEDAPAEPTPAEAAPIEAAPESPVATPGTSESSSTTNSLIDSVPPAIGRNFVFVSADLHYLHVHTTIGKATVLGNLSCWEREQGARGIRIHRSHWVARQHVRRIARSAAGWYCELNAGNKLPISRRRASAVREELGSGFSVRDPAATTPATRAGQRPSA
jgi:hypothetical protein